MEGGDPGEGPLHCTNGTNVPETAATRYIIIIYTIAEQHIMLQPIRVL